MKVRTVTLELLRAGPPHNQLLSPLTQYLGVCGESGAEVVRLPYEHHTFERRLKELRYEDGTDEDASRRLEILRTTGERMAEILAAVPGLPGALSAGGSGTLTHLRLVVSASELSLLPFELSKVPRGAELPRESWLLLQPHAPVCLTRHIRSVPTVGVRWPVRPKVLFVAGNPDDIPFDEHLTALQRAVAPWVGADSDTDGLLTVLENATLQRVEETIAGGGYTHVHILAHGAEDENAAARTSFGLALTDDDGFPDVVSGERLASALTAAGGGTSGGPAVVTAATCDSANQGSIETPGASLAHVLHEAGIPLVVASQFPLSKEGSVALVRMLYGGLLWGDNPLPLLFRVRGALHSRFTNHSHDWASVVVYEALPDPAALEEQLQELAYEQAKRALNVALADLEALVPAGCPAPPDAASLGGCEERIERARRRLPSAGRYQLECIGLRGSCAKRRAEVAYRLALASRGAAATEHWQRCHELLEDALEDYREAMVGFLVPLGEPGNRKASLHWVLMQYSVLAAVLDRDLDEEPLMAVKLVAEQYLELRDAEERAWAHGSLAEMWLLRLTVPGQSAAKRVEAAAQAQAHTAAILDLFPRPGAFPVFSTRRQILRYLDWWGDRRFVKALKVRGVRRGRGWGGEHGLLATARRMVAILDRERPTEDADHV